MNLKNITTMLTIVCLAATTVIIGCKKKEQPATPKAPAMEMKGIQNQATTAAEEANKTAAAVIEQTTCPIMDGNKINKKVFVEYKGKKVYFCCASCKGDFEKDPEKYISKLPQFAK